MTSWTLTSLDGTHPAGFLAALGLCSITPNARLAFSGATPILISDADLEEATAAIAAAIEEATHPDAFPLPDIVELRTTTPRWSTLSGLCEQSWVNDAIDAVMHTVDAGRSTSDVKPTDPDPKAPSGSLILISGRSYLRKSLAELWPPPTAKRSSDPHAHLSAQRASLRASVRTLLTGDTPPLHDDAMGLRYTVTEASPRLRHGVEGSVIQPLTEALAYLGATRLLPHQLGVAPSRIGATPEGVATRAGLTWALNPVPLTSAAMIAVQEQQAAPADWEHYTALTRPIGGGTKASQFVEIRHLGTHA